MKRLVLVGLPETGKTTFLTALFELLEHPDANCAFKVDSLPGEMGQLNKNRDSLRKCQIIPRTPGAATHEVNMKVASSREAFDISIPDNTGEMFNQLLEDRKWDGRLLEQIEGANGILLFVHTANLKEPTRLDDIEAIAEEHAKIAGENAGQGQTRGAEPPFEYKTSPTQVLLVDLLQLISERAKTPLRMGVVVSAWDRVQGIFDSPKKFLSAKYPLLDQFLETNADSFEFCVRGLSSTGGQLPEDADRLKKLPVSERVAVVSEDSTTRDLTKLLEWFYE